MISFVGSLTLWHGSFLISKRHDKAKAMRAFYQGSKQKEDLNAK